MSASDKKQQRKAALDEGMTQKQRLEQLEAQKAKRNRTIYTVVGAVCAVAAAGLLIWNGISNRSNGNATALLVDGNKFTVGDVQYYYTGVKNNQIYLSQMYSAYGINMGYDYNQDEGAQWYSQSEGLTYADHFREAAVENLKNTYAMVKAAKAAGYTLSADGKAQIADQFAQIDKVCAQNGITRTSYFNQVYGNGLTEKVFRRNLENDILASEYKTVHGESYTYDEAALQNYYDNNKDTLDSYSYTFFAVSGAVEDPDATDEVKNAAMDKAQDLANAALADLMDASNKESAMGAAADEYANTDPTVMVDVVGSTLNSTGGAYASWLMESGRKPGDVTVAEGLDAYYVVLFQGRRLNEENAVAFRHILINASLDDSTATDADGNAIPSEASMAAARATAQGILDQYLAGAKTEDAFAALANDKSEDTGSNTDGGLYENVARGNMVEPVNDWIFDSARQPGDTGIVEYVGHYAGVHVLYFVGQQGPVWQYTATTNLRSADQSTWEMEQEGSVDVEQQEGMKFVGSTNTLTSTPASDTEAETSTEASTEAPAETSTEAPAETASAQG